MSSLAHTNVTVNTLPPSLRFIVAKLVADHRRYRKSWERWRHYEKAKNILSRRVGWAAPPHDRDIDLFHLAVDSYVEGVGL